MSFENCSVTFSPDGRTVFSGGSHGVLRALDVATGVERFAAPIPHGIFGLAVTPDGLRIAVAGGGRNGHYLALHDTKSGAKTHPVELDEDAGAINSPLFSPDGNILVYRGDFTISLLDLASGRDASFATEAANVIMLPDGSVPRIERDRIDVIGLEGKLRTSFPRGDAATTFYGARKAKVFAVDTMDQRAIVFEASGKALGEVPFKVPMRFAVSPDGERVALGQHSVVRVIEVRSGTTLSQIDSDAAVLAIDFAPDGQRLALGFAEALVKVVPSGKT